MIEIIYFIIDQIIIDLKLANESILIFEVLISFNFFLGCDKHKGTWFWWLLFEERIVDGYFWKRFWETISHSGRKYSSCLSGKRYYGQSKKWNWKNCSIPHSIIRKNWCFKRLYPRYKCILFLVCVWLQVCIANLLDFICSVCMMTADTKLCNDQFLLHYSFSFGPY